MKRQRAKEFFFFFIYHSNPDKSIRSRIYISNITDRMVYYIHLRIHIYIHICVVFFFFQYFQMCTWTLKKKKKILMTMAIGLRIFVYVWWRNWCSCIICICIYKYICVWVSIIEMWEYRQKPHSVVFPWMHVSCATWARQNECDCCIFKLKKSNLSNPRKTWRRMRECSCIYCIYVILTVI